MKHIFIFDTTIVKGRQLKKWIFNIEEYAKKENLDYEIYVSGNLIKIEEYVNNIAKLGVPVRFYACGGDGTLSCIVNGVYQYDNAQVATIPIGGNDFIRIFGPQEQFFNVDNLVKGTVSKFDLIKYNGRTAINQCSMGFDAEVCAKQHYFKKWPFLSLNSAYTVALIYNFFKMVNHDLVISIDDEPPIKKGVLFCLVANSRWYGGGYKGAPNALPDDGLLDVIIIERRMKRIQLFKLIGKYKSGDFLDFDFTTLKHAKKITIRSDKPEAVNFDGECEQVIKATFEIVPSAVNFVVPASSTYFEDKKSGKISQTN